MKWKVEEANPKTGEYPSLNIDASDYEAAEALGKRMALSASDISHRRTWVDGKTSSHFGTQPTLCRRLPIHEIVLLSAGATLICTVAAVWVVQSVAAVPALDGPTAITAAVDDGDIQGVKFEIPEDGKLTPEISDADREPAMPADEGKPPSEEQLPQVNVDDGDP